eukprot:NODE_261_length_2066_cov_406.258800_g177_i0.p1 GENE.NODE_261_length_2066_cov_406.258800_g177_i0~~NODE_261_length_2066_cov_406.258800_g177_i0.p1  ORF type:complete len:506 (-),score=115.57 NODE_261_length_2066_cov_406.258800_g177_i0:521-2038(-)
MYSALVSTQSTWGVFNRHRSVHHSLTMSTCVLQSFTFGTPEAEQTIDAPVRQKVALISDQNDTRPVCLDYLKGLCNRRRWKCKFAHPALPACADSEENEGVCKVWLLTGFCKFGEECHFTHPGQVTAGSRNGSRSSSRRSSAHSVETTAVTDEDCVSTSSMNTSMSSTSYTHSPYSLPTFNMPIQPVFVSVSPPPSLPPTPTVSRPPSPDGKLSPLSPDSPSAADETTRKVSGLLNRLTLHKFDSLVHQLQAILATGGMTMPTMLPLIARKASKEPQLASLYAKTTSRLIGAAAASDNQTAKAQLWQLVVDGVDTPSANKKEACHPERLGSMQFLGELFMEGLVTEARITTMLDMLMEKIGREQDKTEAAFLVELTCKLLTTAGQELDRRWPRVIDFFLQQLKEAAKCYPNRIQVLVLNVVELHTVQHWKKPVAIVPPPAPTPVSVQVPPVVAQPVIHIGNPQQLPQQLPIPQQAYPCSYYPQYQQYPCYQQWYPQSQSYACTCC